MDIEQELTGFSQSEDTLEILEGFNHIFKRLYLWVIHFFEFIDKFPPRKNVLLSLFLHICCLYGS